MNLTNNFTLQELVHPDIYNHPAIGERCANWLSPYLAPTLQSIKDNTQDVITVNSWSFGGHRIDAGLRLPMIKPSTYEIQQIILRYEDANERANKLIDLFIGVGAYLSGHKYGGSADMQPKLQSARSLWLHIIDNQELYPNIIRVEHIDITPTWVHIDVGDARKPNEKIKIFNP